MPITDSDTPQQRNLTQNEIKLLRQVFGNKINYNVIRIFQGSSADSSAITIDNNITFPGKNYHSDFTQASFDESPGDVTRNLAWLVHEVTHVWQNQIGSVSMLDKMLQKIEYGTSREQYEYRQSDDFTKLNFEQQAAAVEDRFLVQHGLPPRNDKDFSPGADPSVALPSLNKMLNGFDLSDSYMKDSSNFTSTLQRFASDISDMIAPSAQAGEVNMINMQNGSAIFSLSNGGLANIAGDGQSNYRQGPSSADLINTLTDQDLSATPSLSSTLSNLDSQSNATVSTTSTTTNVSAMPWDTPLTQAQRPSC